MFGPSNFSWLFFFTIAKQPPVGQGLPVFEDSWAHAVRHTSLGRTPLDEWSARRRDLYLIQDTHNRQASMPPTGIEPKISGNERPQTHALDRAATGIGFFLIW